MPVCDCCNIEAKDCTKCREPLPTLMVCGVDGHFCDETCMNHQPGASFGVSKICKLT